MVTYWQIAAGSNGRDYSSFFLKYGIAFVGGDSQIASMSEVKKGDIVTLKQGRTTIIAAGRVIEVDGIHSGYGDKEWLSDFDGWDLPAYCYVEWLKPKKLCMTDGLTRSTIQRVHQSHHKSLINNILETGERVVPETEPDITKKIDDNSLLKFLICEGLRPSSANELAGTISKIRLLAQYYYSECYWDDVREHETRTFLVIPFLLALGWSEQQIKIELSCSSGRIDIACFKRNYCRNNEECLVIIETKGFSSGLDYAPAQAVAYSKDFPQCKSVIVTNGYCYKVYLRDAEHNQFTTEPAAYLNILNPRERYPIDPANVDGGLNAIKWLLPNTFL
ncbi:hypothetical protein D3C80_544550 [compost metagenome]